MSNRIGPEQERPQEQPKIFAIPPTLICSAELPGMIINSSPNKLALQIFAGRQPQPGEEKLNSEVCCSLDLAEKALSSIIKNPQNYNGLLACLKTLAGEIATGHKPTGEPVFCEAENSEVLTRLDEERAFVLLQTQKLLVLKLALLEKIKEEKLEIQVNGRPAVIDLNNPNYPLLALRMALNQLAKNLGFGKTPPQRGKPDSFTSSLIKSEGQKSG